MKTDQISVYNSNLSFRAGKVRVFSDFDRTFLPASHRNFVKNSDSSFVEMITKNFKNFKEFLDKTRDGLKFTITTGRTFGEFLTMAETARKRKFPMPLPDTLIVKNGSDEHLRVGTDESFYNGGEFPFKYEITNKEKEEKFKQTSGWDGAKVKQILKDIFKSYDFRIVEADSEHSVRDYGARSLFSEGKLEKEIVRENKTDYSIGIRRDGSLKVFTTYPDFMPSRERNIPNYKEMESKIKAKFSENGIRVANAEKPDRLYGRACFAYCPEVEEFGINGKLTKFYDTCKAVKEAAKENDLVITAGDSSNDKEMLNPGLYFKYFLDENALKKYGLSDLKNEFEAPNSLIEILDKNPELAETFIKMPFTGIIVKQEDGKNKLSELLPFTQGKYKKIIVVEEGELQNGIKDAIKLYSEQNPKYKEKLSDDLSKQIKSEGNGDKSGGKSGGDDDSNKSDSNKWKYALGAFALLLAGCGVYLWNKNKKQEKRVQEQHLIKT